MVRAQRALAHAGLPILIAFIFVAVVFLHPQYAFATQQGDGAAGDDSTDLVGDNPPTKTLDDPNVSTTDPKVEVKKADGNVENTNLALSEKKDPEKKPAASAENDGKGAETLTSNGEPAGEGDTLDAAPVALGTFTVRYEKASGTQGAAEGEMILSAQADQSAPKASIYYKTHVQNDGWQSFRSNGQEAGTTGRSLRLEAIEFYLDAPGASGSVHGQVHVQNQGWQEMRTATDGAHATVGTSGQSLRLEAIKLTLSGEISKWYDLKYCVHVQNIGWQNSKSNGEEAGTHGQSLRLEGIEIWLEKKEGAPKGESDGGPGLTYRAHVQNVGWQAKSLAGSTMGTSGQSLRMEAIQIWLDAASYKGSSVSYRAHVQNDGWKSPASNGQLGGTTGRSLRMEALEITLSGSIKNQYDIMYRAHVQNIGWQPWVINGATAGTTGKGLRMEALEVKLVKKGAYSVSEGSYVITPVNKYDFAIDDPGYSTSAGTQMQLYANSSNNAQKFYLRNEGSGRYSVQSVASGLFLADQAGKFVQTADVNDAYHRWTLSWDAGVLLTNVQTGKVLALNGNTASGTKLVTAGRSNANATAQRWMLQSTPLIADGYYIIQSRLGTVVDVAGASYANGTNVQAYSRNDGAAQKFHIYQNNGSYVIENCKSFSVLDVNGKSTADGANVMQQAWNGGNNQRWNATLDRQGYIRFQSKHSGKMLDIKDASKNNGANIRQWASNGSQGQQWKLVSTSRYSLSGNETLDRNVANVLRSHGSLRSAYDWTVNHSYREGERYYSNPHVLPDSRTIGLANDFFSHGSGNCYRFAATFSWLARGLGYSSRVISGWVSSVSGGRAPHGWAEVDQNGKAYVCDPDMQEAIPYRNFYMQTYAGAPIDYHSW